MGGQLDFVGQISSGCGVYPNRAQSRCASLVHRTYSAYHPRMMRSVDHSMRFSRSQDVGPVGMEFRVSRPDGVVDRLRDDELEDHKIDCGMTSWES
jgi:hypothetical protein